MAHLSAATATTRAPTTSEHVRYRRGLCAHPGSLRRGNPVFLVIYLVAVKSAASRFGVRVNVARQRFPG